MMKRWLRNTRLNLIPSNLVKPLWVTCSATRWKARGRLIFLIQRKSNSWILKEGNHSWACS